MDNFIKTTNGFNYLYEKILKPGDEKIIKMPAVSSNKRGINDIGWQTDSEDLILYGTLSNNPYGEDVMWERIYSAQDVNKVTACIKANNTGTKACKLLIRVIMN